MSLYYPKCKPLCSLLKFKLRQAKQQTTLTFH